MMRRQPGLIVLLYLGLACSPILLGQSAEEMARMAQDPLASISAIASDNTFNFGTGADGEEQVAPNLQIQPVYSITLGSWNFIPRAIIPIIGAPPESDLPGLGPPRPPGSDRTWGLSDIATQFFFAPSGGAKVKWGLGPQFSWRTRTDDRVGGAGWGAGPAGVVLTDFGSLSVGALVGNMWSYDGDFSTMLVQPLIYYNFESMPGVSLSYNPAITFDWKGDSGNKVTLPVGLGIGKTFALGGGFGMDLSGGAYGMVVRPDGGPKWQLKVAAFFILPRN